MFVQPVKSLRQKSTHLFVGTPFSKTFQPTLAIVDGKKSRKPQRVGQDGANVSGIAVVMGTDVSGVAAVTETKVRSGGSIDPEKPTEELGLLRGSDHVSPDALGLVHFFRCLTILSFRVKEA